MKLTGKESIKADLSGAYCAATANQLSSNGKCGVAGDDRKPWVAESERERVVCV